MNRRATTGRPIVSLIALVALLSAAASVATTRALAASPHSPFRYTVIGPVHRVSVRSLPTADSRTTPRAASAPRTPLRKGLPRAAAALPKGEAARIVSPPASLTSGPGEHASEKATQLHAFPLLNATGQVASFGSDQKVVPPDTQLAAGTSDLMEVDNAAALITDRSGTQLKTFDLYAFWSVPAASEQFSDPRVLYDPATSRWFMSGMAFNATSFDSGQAYVAASQTSDPTGSWNLYVVASNTGGALYDQPKIGFNSDKLVISWNDFSQNGNQFSGAETHVLNKSDLTGGVPSPVQAVIGPDLTRFGLVPAQSLSSSTTEWIVYNNADCGSPPQKGLGCERGAPTLGAIAITGTPASHNVAEAEYDPGIDLTFAPDGFNPPVLASQPNSGPSIDAGDDRLLSAVWYAGALWTAATDTCASPPSSLGVTLTPCIRMIELAAPVNGSAAGVVQDFDLGAVDASFWDPAVTFNLNGDAVFSFAYASLLIDASAGVVDQQAGQLGTLESFIPVATGAATYACSAGPPLRWGDYSGAAFDPADPGAAWSAGEYTHSAANCDWGTAALQTVVDPVISTATPAVALVSGSPKAVTIDGQGFQPGATVTFTPPGGTAASVPATVANPFTITTTFPGSSVMGQAVVTVTNPDGTTVTADAYSYVIDNSGHVYTVDGYGGIHPDGSAPALSSNVYWPYFDIARGVALDGDGLGGYLLDAFGGLHAVGDATRIPASFYFGFDIARSVVLAPWSTTASPAGYVLDGYGGINPFGGAPSVTGGPYWPGFDIARSLVLLPSSTPADVEGYVLDGYGGIHPFGGAAVFPGGPYWAAFDIARVLVLAPGDPRGGYVMDGYGGIHPVGTAPPISGGPYFGYDIARSLTMWSAAPGGAPGGWMLDGDGAVWKFGSAPAVSTGAYWPGFDIARGLSAPGEGASSRKH